MIVCSYSFILDWSSNRITIQPWLRTRFAMHNLYSQLWGTMMGSFCSNLLSTIDQNRTFCLNGSCLLGQDPETVGDLSTGKTTHRFEDHTKDVLSVGGEILLCLKSHLIWWLISLSAGAYPPITMTISFYWLLMIDRPELTIMATS